MRIGRKHLGFGALILLLTFVVPSRADWEGGKRAYDEGDYATAVKELKPLAEKGNAEAQALLGLMFELGRGLPRDSGQAFKWYKAAAEQGNADGEFHLGIIYRNGVGVPKDAAQGLKWLKLSAAQGQPDAYLMLGMACLNVQDAPRDVVQADMWLHLAAARGEPLAARLPAKVERQMTPDQIAKAKALAAVWQAKVASRSHEKEKVH